MKDHKDLIIQEEIDCSSWFAFSLIIKPESKLTREQLMNQLNALGFEYRPILTGNFTKQAVLKYFDYQIHKKLKNVNYLHKKGLYVGNYPYEMKDAFNCLKKI
jgi:CDP-6-deoxy-D-xylo-4-hexulose-3-dehydrase